MNPARTPDLITFSDSLPLAEEDKQAINNDELSFVWIAQRLLQSKIMNLCQGDLQHDTHKHTLKQWYYACAILAGACVVSALLFNASYLYVLTKRTTDLDNKIAVIYRKFFPDAKQIISPRFRVEQLLKNKHTAGDTSPLWELIDKLGVAFTKTPVTIEQFRFQGHLLSVTLVAKDFAGLEELQSQLQQDHVKVTQSQATNRDQQVVATLELSL